MKAIVNPEYQKAPYELTYMPVNSHQFYGNHRFNSCPSLEIQKDEDKLLEWVIQNSIPPVIRTEEE